ncbi:hypothetical protein RFI_28208 [Reticulomyxa filosa]|uniref:Globin family profile domain-containing protein n=1 Tax=Reticulomyxa filosa TaxID=46433 RepID=X6M5I1_RETFI|nr:hypothetical protein RFI_28208 [Reticulomyxa filosa]|eukprot:ETO09179.1 hypothetical protein RFI_28208 [Reticulomyxa filosa]
MKYIHVANMFWKQKIEMEPEKVMAELHEQTIDVLGRTAKHKQASLELNRIYGEHSISINFVHMFGQFFRILREFIIEPRADTIRGVLDNSTLSTTKGTHRRSQTVKTQIRDVKGETEFKKFVLKMHEIGKIHKKFHLTESLFHAIIVSFLKVLSTHYAGEFTEREKSAMFVVLKLAVKCMLDDHSASSRDSNDIDELHLFRLISALPSKFNPICKDCEYANPDSVKK